MATSDDITVFLAIAAIGIGASLLTCAVALSSGLFFGIIE